MPFAWRYIYHNTKSSRLQEHLPKFPKIGDYDSILCKHNYVNHVNRHNIWCSGKGTRLYLAFLKIQSIFAAHKKQPGGFPAVSVFAIIQWYLSHLSHSLRSAIAVSIPGRTSSVKSVLRYSSWIVCISLRSFSSCTRAPFCLTKQYAKP